MKILLADTDPSPLQKIMEQRGYEVVTVSNATPALAMWLKQPFDVILINVENRDIAGLKLIAAIRKKETGKHIRAVAISNDPEQKDRCLEAGMDHYINRPVQEQELFTILEASFPAPGKDQAEKPGEELRPAINKNAAMELLDGDEELFLEIVKIFSEDAPKYREKLKNALDTNDADEAGHYAHTLKGAAANICAHPLKEAAREIERATKKNDLDRARMLYENFDREFQRLASHLSKIVPA